MKNSELRKLISEYLVIKEKMKKKNVDSFKLNSDLKQIEKRYFHETGKDIKMEFVK
jgi:hypothetical protein